MCIRDRSLFAENLAGVFARPRWDVSFHVNMDAASLIGMDTFRGGEVSFRPGPVYTAAKAGGFAILDEINMAKSEAMAVLHATLDFRRTIDVPGYERMELHPATRFIAVSYTHLDVYKRQHLTSYFSWRTTQNTKLPETS